MAERKPLFLSSEGFSEEMAQADSLTLGGLTMGGNVVMQSNKITGLGAATASGDALSFDQSGAQLSGLIIDTNNLTFANGGKLGAVTAAGNIDMADTYKVTSLASATTAGDALAYGQGSALLGSLVISNGGSINLQSGGASLIGVPTPTNDQDAANKAYVDGLTGGAAYALEPVKVASISNGTLASDFEDGDTVDGYTLSTGDRILIRAQSTASENGIYVVNASGAPTRAADMAAASDASNKYVFVEQGNTYDDTLMFCSDNSGSAVVGTDDLSFDPVTGVGSFVAGTGLARVINTNTLNVGAGNGISVGADTVAVNPDIASTTTTEANAISVGANGVSVKVDNSTIEGSLQGSAGAESLRLKDGGITGAKMASNVSFTTTGTLNFAGGTMTGNITMTGGSTVTGLPATPSGSTDAASKSYVDSVASGLGWTTSALTLGYKGNDTVANINGLSPAAGDAYVVTDSGTLTTGSLGVAAGDFVEFSGTAWLKLLSNSGGFVPAGTRAILSNGTIQSPYTNATDNDKIVEFSGSSNTATDTGDTVDSTALLIQDPAHVGYWDNLGFVYEGTVPTGEWIQFTGAGQLNAGNGIDITANTISVDADSESGGNIQPVSVTGNGVGLDINAIGGVGIEADGSANLRIATTAAGNGLTGGGGVALAVDPDNETGGNIQQVNVTANGVGLDVSAIAGTNLEADGSGNLRIAATAAGNGLVGGGASTLAVGEGNGITVTSNAVSVDVDSETGGNIQPANLTANGVGLDVSAIAGTGLEADGSANLRIAAAAAGDGLSGGGGSALAINLEASNPSLQISSDELGLKIDPDGGLQKTATGTSIKIDTIPYTTLQTTSQGLYVTGLPSLFKIADVATISSVTAANLGTLTSGSTSVADSLHKHSSVAKAETSNYQTQTDTTAPGDPVYFNAADKLGKATANADAKARVIGVVRTGAGAPGVTPTVVTHGECTAVLSGAAANTPYYLQANGGIGTSLPAAGNRVILVGYAVNTTDLWVDIRDYGKLAA